jgi:hypothetical protein
MVIMFNLKDKIMAICPEINCDWCECSYRTPHKIHTGCDSECNTEGHIGVKHCIPYQIGSIQQDKPEYERCEICKYIRCEKQPVFIYARNLQDQEYERNKLKLESPKFCYVCVRNPPSWNGGHPMVNKDDYCGEFRCQ